MVAMSLLRTGQLEPAADLAAHWLPQAPTGGVTHVVLATIGYDLVGRHQDALAAWALLGEDLHGGGWKQNFSGWALRCLRHRIRPTQQRLAKG